MRYTRHSKKLSQTSGPAKLTNGGVEVQQNFWFRLSRYHGYPQRRRLLWLMAVHHHHLDVWTLTKRAHMSLNLSMLLQDASHFTFAKVDRFLRYDFWKRNSMHQLRSFLVDRQVIMRTWIMSVLG